jgi:hypothetical protein
MPPSSQRRIGEVARRIEGERQPLDEAPGGVEVFEIQRPGRSGAHDDDRRADVMRADMPERGRHVAQRRRVNYARAVRIAERDRSVRRRVHKRLAGESVAPAQLQRQWRREPRDRSQVIFARDVKGSVGQGCRDLPRFVLVQGEVHTRRSGFERRDDRRRREQDVEDDDHAPVQAVRIDILLAQNDMDAWRRRETFAGGEQVLHAPGRRRNIPIPSLVITTSSR